MPIDIPPVVVFAYDFAHRKTQDILVRLFLDGVPVQAVLAAPRVKLDIAPSTVRTKVRGGGALHPRQIAERLGADYLVAAHDSEEAIAYATEAGPLAVIGGARILGPDMIAAFPEGIVNLHPGLIPEVRGLDALLWAVHDGTPLGVTAHLIDRRVDAGTVLARRPVSVWADDTIFDLSERLYAAQLDVLAPALSAAARSEGEALGVDAGRYNRKMTPTQERAALDALPAYLEQHAS